MDMDGWYQGAAVGTVFWQNLSNTRLCIDPHWPLTQFLLHTAISRGNENYNYHLFSILWFEHSYRKADVMYQPLAWSHGACQDRLTDGQQLAKVFWFKYPRSTVTTNNKMDEKIIIRMSKFSVSNVGLDLNGWYKKKTFVPCNNLSSCYHCCMEEKHGLAENLHVIKKACAWCDRCDRFGKSLTNAE